MRLARTVVGFTCGALWALAPAIDASAEMEVGGGFKLDGEVRAGVQGLVNEPSDKASAKFDEYRDIHTGVFLENLRLRVFSPDGLYYGWLAGSKWGRQDQEYSLGAGRIGLWEASFGWDQTPHVFSRDTARILAQDVGRSVFVLPTPRPNLQAYDGGRVIDQVGVLWQTARLSLFLTPSTEWEIKSEYTRIHKEGTRALDITYQTPMNNFAEYLEPIRQLIHDFRIGATYAQDNWQVKFGYVFSMFQNFRNSVTGDNPCYNLGDLGLTGLPAVPPHPQPSGCAVDGDPGVPPVVSNSALAGAEASGKVSLAPNNMAHTVTIAGGISLPMRTRVNANLSYSVRLQNDQFLPHTVIPYIAGEPGLALPDKSLDGVTGVFLANLFASSRPMPPLTLSFKYRIFNLHDMGNSPIFPCSVESDGNMFCDAGGGTPGGIPRQAKRREYTKQNAEVDGRWRFGPLASLTLGLGWEGWDRNSTWNVYHTDEPFGKAVFGMNPADWLLAQVTYRASFKRNSNYNPYPTHIATDQSQLERKLDVAERNRQQVDMLAQVMATDTFSVATIGSWRADDFVDSPLGTQQSVGWSAGVDISWRPTERFSLSAGYVHEWNFTKQLQNTISPSQQPFPPNPSYLWLSDNADTIDTYRLNLNAVLVPKTLDLGFGFSYAEAVGSIRTRNVNPPPKGGAGNVDRSATAQRLPTFEDELLRIDLGLTYYFWKGWSAKLSYALESWHKKDFRTDTLNPFTNNITSVFLGEDYKNYTANIVAVTLGYRF